MKDVAMVTDRVTRNPQTLAGNQLAAALTKSGVVKNDVPLGGSPEPRGRIVQSKTREIPTLTQVVEKTVLPQLRDYLARLVAGAKLPKSEMGVSLADWQCGLVNKRLQARGLIVVKIGHYGGAVATPRLIALARANITDAELRRLTLVDVPDDEVVAADEVEDAGQAAAPPMSNAEQRQLFVRNIFAWLRRGVDGQHLRVSQIGHGNGGTVHNAVARLRGAGLLEKVGENSSSYHVVPKDQHERVLALTHEELTSILWRLAPRGMVPLPKPDADDAVITDAVMEAATAPVGDEVEQPTPRAMVSDDPLARVLDQFLTILVRMDARFSRLERELGLPPIEQEPAK